MRLTADFEEPREPLFVLPVGRPGYWRNETSGVLHYPVMTYLEGGMLTPHDIAALRAYIRQWINAPVWQGPLLDVLRSAVDDLVDREKISWWMNLATTAGVDPL